MVSLEISLSLGPMRTLRNEIIQTWKYTNLGLYICNNIDLFSTRGLVRLAILISVGTNQMRTQKFEVRSKKLKVSR